MKNIINQLKITGDFLSFSRLNEQSLPLPINFKLNCHYLENEIDDFNMEERVRSAVFSAWTLSAWLLHFPSMQHC